MPFLESLALAVAPAIAGPIASKVLGNGSSRGQSQTGYDRNAALHGAELDKAHARYAHGLERKAHRSDFDYSFGALQDAGLTPWEAAGAPATASGGNSGASNVMGNAPAMRQAAEQSFMAQEREKDRALQRSVSSNQMISSAFSSLISAEASRYSFDTSAAASRYSADRSLEGTKYSTDRGTIPGTVNSVVDDAIDVAGGVFDGAADLIGNYGKGDTSSALDALSGLIPTLGNGSNRPPPSPRVTKPREYHKQAGPAPVIFSR